MFKLRLINIILFLIITANCYGFYYTFSIEDIPMQLLTADISNNAYGGFINIANASAGIYFTDDFSLKFRLKDSFMNIPPAGVTNTNYFYADRLSVEYNGDNYGILAGRDLYLENNGILIGNMADGLRVRASLFGLNERLYVYHSGIPGTLPPGVNQFYISNEISILSNGPARISGGGVVEAVGLFGKSLSFTGLYSMDLTTNNTFNPFYAGLTYENTIIPELSYTISGYYMLGNYISNVSLSGFAGDVSMQYFTGESVKFGLTGEAAFASGDSTNTTNVYEGFKSFGQYNTGFVLNHDFSNIFLIKFGGLFLLLNDNLTLKADYIYCMRLSTNDTGNNYLNGYYGNGFNIGSEIDGTVYYTIDPNLTLFANAGLFMPGDAYTTNSTTTNQFKVIAGISLKI